MGQHKRIVMRAFKEWEKMSIRIAAALRRHNSVVVKDSTTPDVCAGWAGRCGLMDSMLGSGDRVRGFKTRSW